ncbi:SgcJ/EcaC family oxidoreductase [Catellatospora tritici]|uniref:SgcJ/EcaC family oxidoreductase n=1 Tax=Catellatospora tritici TaxID=2851566 RepID=UPI001C2DAD18|nr:SgcJ/EcaC family oxidoreductase [Catellatospora tritici]MBV1856328.1 SgcJ/EcaC family oxidoreductase [Catellatospora tritici]
MTIIDSRPVSAEDKASVLKFIQKITESWNANEAEPLCEVYADDASVVLPGAILKGRPAITDWMAAAFAGKWKGTHVLGHPLEYRYIRDDVLLVVSHGGAYMPGDTEVPVHFAIRGMWVFIKDNPDDEWIITAYANTPVYATIELPETHLS